ncbi:MAG: hypothetical protein ACFFC7_07975 [Candidatus Hermodarchaeota archaeon]
MEEKSLIDQDFLPSLINAVVILITVLTLMYGTVLFWRIYRKYQYRTFLGYSIGLILLSIGLFTEIFLYLVPSDQNYLELTQFVHRIGASISLIALIVFLMSIFFFSSFEPNWQNMGHLMVISLMLGISIGLILNGGLSHVFLPDGSRGIHHTNSLVLFLFLALIGFFSFVYRIIHQYLSVRTKKQELSKQREIMQFGRNRIRSRLFLLILLIAFILLILSRTEFGAFMPSQTWKLALVFAFSLVLMGAYKDPSIILKSDVQLLAFLVIGSSGIPIYTYQFTDFSPQKKEQSQTFGIAPVLSAIQSYIRFVMGEGGQLKYLLAEQGVLSIEQEMDFYFCLVTNKMNPFVSETTRAIKIRFMLRFHKELEQYLKYQVAELSFFRGFDSEITLFEQFFL